jgi:hypothetical protein
MPEPTIDLCNAREAGAFLHQFVIPGLSTFAVVESR